MGLSPYGPVTASEAVEVLIAGPFSWVAAMIVYVPGHAPLGTLNGNDTV